MSKSVFFSGCSWGCIYQVGVYKGLLDKYGNEVKDFRWGGVSAGCLLALAACLNKSVEETKNMFDEMQHIANKYGVFGNMSIFHEAVLQRWIPDGGDEYKFLIGKLYIGITYPICKFVLVSKWSSNTELKDCIHASMHIPFYCTHISYFRGCLTLDAGFVKNMTLIDENTITVSPISKSADISTNTVTSKEMFFLFSKQRATEIFEQGYKDALQFRSKKIVTRRKKSFIKYVLKYLLCTLGWSLRIIEQFGVYRLLLIILGIKWFRKRIKR